MTNARSNGSCRSSTGAPPARRTLSRPRAERPHVRNHDLIHESFLRLIDQRRVDWQSRAHFFAIAAQSMRRILVDHARRRSAGRHGGDVRRLALDEVGDLAAHRGEDLVALDEALTVRGLERRRFV